MKAALIFPHQLFEQSTLLTLDVPLYLVEDPRFFSDFAFHKHKLILHRSSMKAYAAAFEKKGHTVHYVDHTHAATLFEILAKKKIKELHYYEIVDQILEKQLHKQAKKYDVTLVEYETPYFLTSKQWIKNYFANKTHFAFTPFYIEQRKRLNVLVHQGKPSGGKWSFDPENRKKMPATVSIPPLKKIKHTASVIEAIEYVEKNFPKNPGQGSEFWLPTTHKESMAWLDDFLDKRFFKFGDYEDAIVADESVLFHSVLSPLLNCGLLTPHVVLEKTLNYLENNKISLNNSEGFIRQLIGWREFVRAVYQVAGPTQRTTNFWQHKKKLPRSFWNATTGIFPLDTIIERVIATSYAHHIERLMILGNFMLLCQINPDEVYSWFMEFFIDAYDWVMVPNVYGMSQYADGGLMTTKPYISSSNYILNMSNFKKEPWCEVWDALYWHFIATQQPFIAKNPRLSVMSFYLKRMKKETLAKKLKIAQAFLKTI